MMNIYTLGIWQETMHGGDTMSLSQALLIAVIGICVVLLELALISVFIRVLSAIIKVFTKKKKTDEPAAAAPAPQAAPAAVSAPAGTPLPDTESAGKLDLVNVDEPTAAVIMAIVSNESGIPLNRLAFKSIKLVEE